MAKSSPAPPVSTFVIRFWHEWSAARSRWRGRIEHVQSGQHADFERLEGALNFVQSLGVMAEDRVLPCQTDASDRS
jgi:hypothetical protein